MSSTENRASLSKRRNSSPQTNAKRCSFLRSRPGGEENEKLGKKISAEASGVGNTQEATMSNGDSIIKKKPKGNTRRRVDVRKKQPRTVGNGKACRGTKIGRIGCKGGQ